MFEIFKKILKKDEEKSLILEAYQQTATAKVWAERSKQATYELRRALDEAEAVIAKNKISTEEDEVEDSK